MPPPPNPFYKAQRRGSSQNSLSIEDLVFSLGILHSQLFNSALEMVGLTGLEPVTLRLSSACSNQLSYRPKFGGAEEARTPDL